MTKNLVRSSWIICFALLACVALPARASAQASPNAAPTVIPINGELRMPDGRPRTDSVLIMISLYDAKDDAGPRWIEQQTVTPDANGNYTVQFGATIPGGLPADLFTGPVVTKWIGVSVDNAPEQPRVMLVSVPYAVKAASADTLAGKPVTDFVLTSSFKEDLRTVLHEAGVLTQPGTTATAEDVTLNFLQKGNGSGGTTDATNVVESGGNVGVGTTTPSDRLHVVGRLRLNTAPSGGSLIATEYGGLARVTAASGAGGGTVAIGREPVTVNGQAAGDYTVELWSGANGATQTLVANGGNVGIGTQFPLQKLDVRGKLRLTTDSAGGGLIATEYGGMTRITSASAAGGGTIAIGREPVLVHGQPAGNYAVEIWSGANGSSPSLVATSGNVWMPGSLQVDGNIAAKYQDVAEWVDSAEPLEAGTIVAIDETAKNRVVAAGRAYDTRIAGAVSPQPGLTLGEPGAGRALIAQSGRVRIKVDATRGAIRPGDLLVSSPTKGHAMRANGKKVRPGTVIGKALEALPSGRGEILALLTLQ